MTLFDELLEADDAFDHERFMERLVDAERRHKIAYWPDHAIPESIPMISDLGCEDLAGAYQAFLDETSLVIDTTRWGNDLDLIYQDQWRYSGTARAWARIEAEWANRVKFRRGRWDYTSFYGGYFDQDVLDAIDRFATLIIKQRGQNKSSQINALPAQESKST